MLTSASVSLVHVSGLTERILGMSALPVCGAQAAAGKGGDGESALADGLRAGRIVALGGTHAILRGS
jgi:hypothetical protein